MTKVHRDAWMTRTGVGFLLAGFVIVGFSVPARGDRISVRGGGQLKGKLIPDKAHPGQWLYIGEVGKTPMVFKKEQIVQVTPEKSPLDEYVVRLAKERTTAQEEFDLGAWCDQNKLADLAQVHYERTVQRDSTFEEAHRRLGHVLMGGRWLNSEEVKEAQGMVKFKGRWMSPEEKERREMTAAITAEGNSWVKRIKLLRDAYLAGPDSRSKDAESRLMAIDQPVAIGPVLKVLGDDPMPALRVVAARILGTIPGPEASAALVSRFLGEDDQSVRQAALNEISHREKTEVLPQLTRALGSSLHQVVNRAAWALGHLNALATVPKLIPVLVTYEFEVVVVDTPPTGPALGFTAGAAGAGSGFASYSSRSIPMLTPPAMGPGSVGYGATSIPTGPGLGSSIGGGSSMGGPTPKLLQIEFRNDEVLAALVKMTGRDFGYDMAAWKQWLNTSFKVEARPSRRVLEP